MNSVPKLFSCSYADCWTEKHFSTEFGVLTPNHTHSHTFFWGCVSRWFGRALAWHARGQRFDPAILHQKSTVLRRKYGAFLFTEADFLGLYCFACIVFIAVCVFNAQATSANCISQRCRFAQTILQQTAFHLRCVRFGRT